jgi:hypothetical protein
MYGGVVHLQQPVASEGALDPGGLLAQAMQL